jgi:RNA polymerase sigma-70 factor (ECF subfamily)
METTSDHIQLQHWIRNRDADAFNELAHRYSGLVFGTCLRITRNRAEAEDATQECFETLANVSEVPKSPIGAWLHRVATYGSLDRVKAQNRRTNRETRYAAEHEKAVIPEWKDIDALVDAVIADWPEEIRMPVVAHFLEGKSYTAIAESLGTSRQLITHRTNKGLKLLRKALRRQGVPVALPSLLIMMTTQLSEAVVVPIGASASIGKIALAGTIYQTGTGAGTATTGAATLGSTLLGGVVMTKSTIVTAGAVATLVVAGTLYTVSQNNDPEVEPLTQLEMVNETSEENIVQLAKLQEDLSQTDAERVRLQRELATTNEQLAILEQKTASKEVKANASEIVANDSVSIDVVRGQVHKNSGAINDSKSMTELVFSEFLYGAQLSPELLEEVRGLIEDSYLEITTLQQFAKLEGDKTFEDVREWKLEERETLDGLMQDRLVEDTYADWTAFVENIDTRESYALLGREMQPYMKRLSPENIDAVMQIATDEHMRAQSSVDESDRLYNDFERVQGSLRLFESLRNRLQEFLPEDQYAQLGNWLTMMENTSLRRLEQLRAQ